MIKTNPISRLARFIAACIALSLSARAATFTVINTDDTGSGSLRQAVVDAAITPGEDTINFAAGLSGQTITLGSEIILYLGSGVACQEYLGSGVAFQQYS